MVTIPPIFPSYHGFIFFLLFYLIIDPKNDPNETDESNDEHSDQEDLGLSKMESLCMNCMENGVTRMMIHKIPYFRELIIASFECPHCGERNNEVTFGGEIQIQVSDSPSILSMDSVMTNLLTIGMPL
jgi:hypothetical protein